MWTWRWPGLTPTSPGFLFRPPLISSTHPSFYLRPQNIDPASAHVARRVSPETQAAAKQRSVNSLPKAFNESWDQSTRC